MDLFSLVQVELVSALSVTEINKTQIHSLDLVFLTKFKNNFTLCFDRPGTKNAEQPWAVWTVMVYGFHAVVSLSPFPLLSLVSHKNAIKPVTARLLCLLVIKTQQRCFVSLAVVDNLLLFSTWWGKMCFFAIGRNQNISCWYCKGKIWFGISFHTVCLGVLLCSF